MRLRLLILVVFLVGCAKEPPSAIVKRVEDAGAGDLRTANQSAIEGWFQKHTDLAVEVKAMCQPVQEKAAASWSSTTEGRVCNAASVASVFHFKERKGDGRGFDAVK
jgi:hypothetical protein